MKKNVLITLLIILVVSLSSYLIYDKVIVNNGNKQEQKENSNENQNIDNQSDENNKPKNDDKVVYVETENQILKLKVMEFINNNDKEVLLSGINNYGMKIKVFNNKLYYFEKDKKIYSYDLETKEKKKLNVDLANTVLTSFEVGDKYIMFYDGYKTLKYDISNDNYQKININCHNYLIYYDYKNDIYYYTNKNNNLMKYNLNTNTEELFSVDSRIVSYTNNYLVIEKGDLVYLYNLNTSEYIELKNINISAGIYDEIVFEYDNNMYYLTKDNKINLVNKDESKSIYEMDEEALVNIRQFDKYLLIDKNYFDESASFDLLNVDESKEEFIIYDLSTKKEMKIDKEKGKTLFNIEGYTITY
ncbi:MAG: hypothetical protein IJ572_04565 [Bacilli bacterium]|nr:hypothetical protein [Bacilli bacterium]